MADRARRSKPSRRPAQALPQATSAEWPVLLRALRQLALAIALPASTSVVAADLQVTIPNGYANLTANDLRLRSSAGEVRWMRVWDGQEWKFNPQWESLSQSWKNLNGSQTADTTAGTVSAGTALAVSSSGGGSGCWVWVDEDRAPTIGAAVIGVPDSAPLIAVSICTYNPPSKSILVL